MMRRGLNLVRNYDNRDQYGWENTPPKYVQRETITTYDAPQPGNIHLAFDGNRIVFEEEERPVADYYSDRVVFDERQSVPVQKNHRHEPRKQVHFVEHVEKVSESVDKFGNQKVYKESIDSEADGFIKKKHKNFELNKSGTFNSYY